MLLTKDANDDHTVDDGDHDDDKKERKKSRRRMLREMKMIIINHDSRLCPFQKLPVMKCF